MKFIKIGIDSIDKYIKRFSNYNWEYSVEIESIIKTIGLNKFIKSEIAFRLQEDNDISMKLAKFIKYIKSSFDEDQTKKFSSLIFKTKRDKFINLYIDKYKDELYFYEEEGQLKEVESYKFNNWYSLRD